MKLEECNKRFDRQYKEIEKQRDLDIRDLQKRYDDLLKQKKLQEKQNSEAMQKMESNNLAAVIEIQNEYDKKLDI